MKLTVINGSPRAKSSNTGILVGHFAKGFLEAGGNTMETLFVQNERPGFGRIIDAFNSTEYLLLAFPLYIDAMPGTVKELIEALAPYRGKRPDLTVLFVVQNGFPETCHNRPIERYLEKLTKRLGCRYGGAILKGGCEGLDIQPPALVDKIFSRFYQIGRAFGETGMLDPELLKKLAYPEHLNAENMKQVIPIVNAFLWDGLLKKNGAMEKSFDRPYRKDD